MAGDPREKLCVIIKTFDKDGTCNTSIEYQTVTIAKLLERFYAFSIGRDDNSVRMLIDIAYPYGEKSDA